jgi:hypothetical protein
LAGGRGPERRQKGRRPVWESERAIRPMRPGNAGGGIVSRRREQRHAVREMRVDPSEPPCGGRFQTAVSCYGPMAAVVNVMVKRRGI